MPASVPHRRAGDQAQPAAGADALRLQLLGPLRLWRDGVEVDIGPRQRRHLLAALLAGAGRPVSTGELVDLLWDEDAPDSAVNVIHKYVGALRRLLEPTIPTRDSGSYLLRRGNGYLFAAAPGMLDLATFRELVKVARTCRTEGRPDVALDRYAEALALWRGSTSDALAGGPRATSISAALDSEFYDACGAAAELAEALGRPGHVLPPLRLAASLAPLHEPVQAALITILAAAGLQAEALAIFHEVRDRLVAELGIDPGPALQSAYQRVLSQAVRPAAPADDGYEVPGTRLPGPFAQPAQLPPDLPAFVGRSRELAMLGGLMADMSEAGRTGPLVVAMDGMGGVGKSTLATRFAHLVADGFPDGQLYLDLRGHDAEEEADRSAAYALRSLLASLGMRTSSLPDTFDARVGAYRSLTAGKRVLVLLDNARDAAQVRPLLPNSAKSMVLVTSRKSLTGLAAFHGAHLLHVELPDLPSARALLRRRLELAPNWPADGAALDAERYEDEIIERCGRLPLALAILAGRIAACPRLSLATVAAELRAGTRRLTTFPDGGSGDPRTAFAWSYRQLSPGAARLFRLFSATLPPGASAEACASLSGHHLARVRQELDELTDAALLDEDDNGRYTAHILVKAYAEELLRTGETEAERRAATARLLQHYLHSSYHAALMLAPRRAPIEPPPAPDGVIPERPDGYDQALRWFEYHHEVLQATVRRATAEPDLGVAPWQLALSLQSSLKWSGRLHDWRDVMRLSLEAARASGDRRGEAYALCGLAGAYCSLGADEEALGPLASAQEIFAEHGLLHELGIVHTDRHRVYTGLGRHECALAESEAALALHRAVRDEQAEIWALEAHGRSLVQLGDFEQARESLDAALVLSEKIGRKADEPEIRMYTAQYLARVGRPRDAVGQLELALRAAGETKNQIDVFWAAIRLADARLSVNEVDASCRAWRVACDTMHAMQGGGSRAMREEIYDVGDRLCEIRYVGASSASSKAGKLGGLGHPITHSAHGPPARHSRMLAGDLAERFAPRHSISSVGARRAGPGSGRR